MTKPGYHHGNLRQALVEAALDVLSREGASGFTVAQAAKAAGVTPAAVYRHFKGRDDLVAEVARQGHERLALLTDTATCNADAGRATLAFGTAFVSFSEQFPGHFAAMYASGLELAHSPALAAAAAQSAGVRARLANRLCPNTETPSPQMVSGLLHALCLGAVQTSPTPRDTLSVGLHMFLKNLGISVPGT